jgi:hypothetical protein
MIHGTPIQLQEELIILKAEVSTLNNKLKLNTLYNLFGEIYSDFLETNYQILKSIDIKTGHQGIHNVQALPLIDRLQQLSTAIEDLCKETDFQIRLDNCPPELSQDTKATLLEIRDYSPSTISPLIQPLKRLMLSWETFFTTRDYPIAATLVKDYVHTLLEKVDALNRLLSTLPVNHIEIAIEFIQATGHIPASTNINTYENLIARHFHHFSNSDFIKILLKIIEDYDDLLGKVELDPSDFKKMDKSLNIVKMRINVYHFALLKLSSFAHSEFSSHVLHSLWMSLDTLYSNTSVCFRKGYIQNQWDILHYFERIDASNELVKLYSDQYQTLLRSVNQRNKLSAKLKTRLKRDLFRADTSFTNINLYKAEIFLRKNDLAHAIESVQIAYQHMNKVPKMKVDELQSELSGVVLQIYFPVFPHKSEKCTFTEYTLKDYRRTFNLPESRSLFCVKVTEYLENIDLHPFLHYANLSTKTQFLTATSPLIQNFIEIFPCSEKKITISQLNALTSLWMYLNKCFELVEGLPPYSDSKLNFSKDYRLLLEQTATIILPLISAALNEDTTDYPRSTLKEANPILWKFYYHLTLLQLQFCQIQAAHAPNKLKPCDLEILTSRADFFKKKHKNIISKSNVEPKTCKDLSACLLERIDQFKEQQKSRLDKHYAGKSTVQKKQKDKSKGKGKDKKKAPPLLSNIPPSLLPSATAIKVLRTSVTVPQTIQNLSEETPWKVVSRKKSKKREQAKIDATQTTSPPPPQLSMPQIETVTFGTPSVENKHSETTPNDQTPTTSTIETLSLAMEALQFKAPVSLSIGPAGILPYRFILPPFLHDIYCRIRIHGYKVYFVGGYIRDPLLGRVPHDADIVTNCPREELALIFNDEGYVNEYRSDLYHLKSSVDISTSNAPDLLTEALKRDLTINAFFLGDNGVVYDPLHVGHTLYSPFLHVIGDNMRARLEQDPSLILRFIRVGNATNKIILPDLLKLMTTYAPAITTLPWGVLKSNVRAMLARSQNEALCNLIFMVQHGIIASLFSSEPIENDYYTLDCSMSEPYAYWKSTLSYIYSLDDSPPLLEIICFLLSLRLRGFLERKPSVNYREALEQTAALLYRRMGKPLPYNGEASLAQHIKTRVDVYYYTWVRHSSDVLSEPSDLYGCSCANTVLTLFNTSDQLPSYHSQASSSASSSASNRPPW